MTASSATNEALLRELTAHVAGVAAEVNGLSKRVDGVDSAAREARDAARDMAAATKAQDLPAKIAELKGQIERMGSDGRADLVNSINRITGEFRTVRDDHEGRIKKLEETRNRFAGATGVLGWLSRHAPWLLALGVSAATFLGLKGPHA